MRTPAAVPADHTPRIERPVFSRSKVFMDTPVIIEVVGEYPTEAVEADIEAAFGWFAEVESRCSRFDPTSELMQLCARPGEPVTVSPLLFAVVQYAAAMAAESGGAFDLAVGGEMARRGFNTNFRTGESVPGRGTDETRPSYQDILIDPERQAITLVRPLTIDLGGVAKGFAIDLAGRALRAYDNFIINAGGDVLARGHNRDCAAWSVGIRHPREMDTLADVVRVSGMAVCTSGDYERRTPDGLGGHILDAVAGTSTHHLSSVTVVAPTAMVADAFATAAFVLGPVLGIEFLERNGLGGLFITPALASFETRGFAEFRE